ncbi:MAG TPA: response regulator [Candidatus Nanoarchaeia archaeon]|nr:response regulator [Candidatus Nanoarchaeia archaeon]
MPQLLVIDDDPAIRDAYQIAFEANGYTVEVATDGKAGLEAAKKNNPDVICVDMIMPFMGGLEFLKAYEPLKHPHTKVIVSTNSQVPADTESDVLELGALKYIRKSAYTPQQLVDLVKQLVSTS